MSKAEVKVIRGSVNIGRGGTESTDLLEQIILTFVNIRPAFITLYCVAPLKKSHYTSGGDALRN